MNNGKKPRRVRPRPARPSPDVYIRRCHPSRRTAWVEAHPTRLIKPRGVRPHPTRLAFGNESKRRARPALLKDPPISHRGLVRTRERLQIAGETPAVLIADNRSIMSHVECLRSLCHQNRMIGDQFHAEGITGSKRRYWHCVIAGTDQHIGYAS